jgi:hypothetical protein
MTKTTRTSHGAYWEFSDVDLSHVEGQYPQAFAEWTALWEQRNNFKNAIRAHDEKGIETYKAAMKQIEKRIDQLPENEQRVVLALTDRQSRREWEQLPESERQAALAATNGQRRHFNSSALHLTRFSVDELERLKRISEAINKGDASGEEIRQAQTMLHGHGYELGTFGKHHDGVDGVAGKKTHRALDTALSGRVPG